MTPSRTHRRLAAGVVAALALASPAAAGTGRMLLDGQPIVGAVAPNGQQGSGGQHSGVGAIAPGGHHANPPTCYGETMTAYNGQTLDKIAEGMANGCISEQAYYNELVRLNPQLPRDGPLRAGDALCFPVQQASNMGRRLQDAMVGAVAPGGNHAYPSNCPANQVGWAEAGDTLHKVARDFHCQNAGGWKGWIAAKLAALNPQIPSLWTPLYTGDVICTSVWF